MRDNVYYAGQLPPTGLLPAHDEGWAWLKHSVEMSSSFRVRWLKRTDKHITHMDKIGQESWGNNYIRCRHKYKPYELLPDKNRLYKGYAWIVNDLVRIRDIIARIHEIV